MAAKTLTLTALPVRNPATSNHYGFGDASSANPNCLYVETRFADDAGNPYSVLVWLETTSDGGATQTNASVPGFTNAQINTLKSQQMAFYNAALTSVGFA